MEGHAGKDLRPGDSKAPPVTVAQVVAFWRQAGPAMWFAKDADFDHRFGEALSMRMRPRRAAISTAGR